MNFRVINLEQTKEQQQLSTYYYKTKKQAVEKAKELGWAWQKNICGEWYTWNEERKGYFK
jgi:hypothetical protein